MLWLFQFLQGLWDSTTFYQTLWTSRSARKITLELVPLYIVVAILGLWFQAVDIYCTR